MLEFCAESGLCVGKTYFKHQSSQVHKGGKGSRWSGAKSMIDLVLVKRDMLCYV